MNIKTPGDSLLNSIGIKFNTDKASIWSGINKTIQNSLGHDYLRKYEFFIREFLDLEDFNMLELGAGPGENIGASIRMWSEYFLNANTITVVDIQKNVVDLTEINKNIIPIHGDLGDPKLLKSLANNKYNLIIDDASHFWEHQILAFENLFDSLCPGGVYICEDIQTSFEQYKKNYSKSFKLDPLSYFMQLSSLVSSKDLKERGHPIFNNFLKNSNISMLDERELKSIKKLQRKAKNILSITFLKHSCIIQKDV